MSQSSDSVHRERLVLVAVNRKAGTAAGQANVRRFCDALATRGFTVEAIPRLDEVLARAAEEHTGGRLHALVAAGGDGTVNAAVNGTPPRLPLAVLPLGTENLLARFLGVPRDPEKAAAIVAVRRLQAFDCGRVGDRLFLITLSVGFDAEVVRKLDAARTGNIRHLTYFKPIWRTMRDYGFPELRVVAETWNAELGTRNEQSGLQSSGSSALRVSSSAFRCRWCFVQNIPAYGGRLNFTPAALGQDGLLDYCLFERAGVVRGLRYLWSVVRGRHGLLPHCSMGRAARLRVEADVAVPVQIDGDPAGTTPIEVTVEPRRAALLVP